ncbi:uncharacterized protein LOC123706705 [Pieris brassicae]|uniref:uncharacterized protein LOC123706705 n=1 Tax=Pieris brassicae TaxID=7116 RepID=UPI001E65E8F3|nr:uncharacterized protein LOC123706705 [Pieris brassicae]
MARREIFICIAFTALVLANEVEDAEQKKRGASKANVLNAIPTGAQKPEYTYSIYPQNPQPAYQNPVSNTFYPNQPSQYYSNSEASQSHQATVPQTSQFVPINFVPNGGYQQKYVVQQKPAHGVFYQPQAKPNYSTQPATGGSPNEYEKLNSHQSAAPKEDSDAQTDYIASDSNNVFKNSYNTRNTYTKI